MKLLSKLITLIFVVGLILLIIAFASGVNFTNLSTYFNDDESYSDPIIYETTTAIDTIQTDLSTRNVIIKTTTDDHITVTYRMHDDDTWIVNEEAGVLHIEQTQKPIIFHWFNFKFASYEILTVTIDIPESWVLSYDLNSGTGDVIYNEGPLHALDVSVNSGTGKAEFDQVSMTVLNIHLETGVANLSNLDITGNLDVKSSTGTLTLNHVDAADISLDTETGRVICDYVTGSVLQAETSTGRVQVSYTNIVGAMDISTSTGSIALTNTLASSFDLSSNTGKVTFASSVPMDLRYDLSTSTGDVTVNNNDQGNKHQTSTGSILLKVRVSTGDIEVSVQE